ncbi:hypothetical protein A2W54_01625 [Candidatus Giovannonibacteria bacterium RIFCSPHIGHO2_02_43_13]|uniref:DUF2238 domain-containing protein n=1 Tax=Candidatus Giovannonibacteria bacterium RIFCSPHIGHO2_02_43_13 TaxID=1798330 RepID=A0A1F5WUT8_9BACT|nr:MAG: hypothetical protein UW28_C0031G0003 [Parcubacteria group bacterium GW2011_GWA2_44_13]OGF74130.1 MAG: hypothetical protein A3E06_02135 [Candidatus Giovannonibacteria bacterium RIFCSPHIGHO2_12_FULL_44_42]OGF79412.1 MAG: hypothetical protein A2W54_01625 [Candidatus Giovannonibacteria bacterium RIFCSPHIGHO2_02_43_13]OGF89510.1 MAG: hypothetical protein A3I94_02765 [Candidatus Giovannonibacteria bacterium RIFCSPLOWO2_02_FULL_43_54]OGF96728.1 MAG: hypothetical protein A3H08_01055 [Candidatus
MTDSKTYSKSFFESFAFMFWFWFAIMALQATGLWYNFPFLFWWFDIIMHFLGGFWIYISARTLIKYFNFNMIGEHDGFYSFIIFIGFVALTGVLWEFFELVLDRYLIHNGYSFLPGVYEDTLSDLFFDLLGGTIAFLIYLYIGKKFVISNS